MTHTEALKLALEAADELAWMLTCGYEVGREGPPRAHRLISKIREFAAQPQQKRPQNCGTGYCSCIECVMEQAQQEPVAWRTFDGEGGYEYRAYEMNEQYAQEWEQRNPKHKDWVEPLYTSPLQRKPQQELWLLETTQTLAKNLARKFYPEVTQWECLNDLAGVISQIDNMTTGLMRKPAQPQQELVAGMVLVPYEPCFEMQEQGSMASDYDLSQSRAKRVYQAMIDMHQVLEEKEPSDE